MVAALVGMDYPRHADTHDPFASEDDATAFDASTYHSTFSDQYHSVSC